MSDFLLGPGPYPTSVVVNVDAMTEWMERYLKPYINELREGVSPSYVGFKDYISHKLDGPLVVQRYEHVILETYGAYAVILYRNVVLERESRSKIGALEAKVTGLEKEKRELMGTVEKLKGTNKDAAALRQERDFLAGELQGEKKKLAASEEKVVYWKGQYHKRDRDVKTALTKLEESRKNEDASSTAKDKRSVELAALKDERLDLTAKNEYLQEKIEKLQQRIHELETHEALSDKKKKQRTEE